MGNVWFVTWKLLSLPGIQILVTSTIIAREPRSFWRSLYQHNTLQSPVCVPGMCHWLLAKLSHWAYSAPVGHYLTGRDSTVVFSFPGQKGEGTPEFRGISKITMPLQARRRSLLPLWLKSVFQSRWSPPALLRTTEKGDALFLASLQLLDRAHC